MSDVTLQELYERILKNPDAAAKLIDTAGCVANAITVGCGGMIHGTLMEAEFRDALCLRPGELLNIPKSLSLPTTESQTGGNADG